MFKKGLNFVVILCFLHFVSEEEPLDFIWLPYKGT